MVSSRVTRPQSLNSLAVELGRERRGEARARASARARSRQLALDLVELAGVDALGLELRAQERRSGRASRQSSSSPSGRYAPGSLRECPTKRYVSASTNAGPSPARACASARAGGLAHGPHAHAVDRLRRDAHDLGARADLARRHRAERRVLAVAVVLAHEHERQPLHLREVEALEDVALVHGAVAEVRDGDAAGRPLQRERRPGRGGDAAADDPERADQPVGRRVHVHRARAAAVDPGRAAEHLVEQLLRVDAERERVAVTAVGRRHAVALLEQARDARWRPPPAPSTDASSRRPRRSGRATGRAPRSRG